MKAKKSYVKMDVLKNIRKNNFQKIIFRLLSVLILNFSLFVLLYKILFSLDNLSLVLIFVIFLIFTTIIDIYFYKKFVLVICPEKSDLFKKYGNVEKIQEIINQIYNTTVYENKYIIISDDYIVDPNDIEKIVKCSDVLGIHKLKHKTNFATDYFKIIITDKYGDEISYSFSPFDEELCNELLMLIASKCKNALLGYTNSAKKYIQDNKIDLPK